MNQSSQNLTFSPNLKLPIIQVFVLGLIFSLVIYAYLSLSLIFFALIGLYIISSFFFLLSKLMIKYEISENYLIKRNIFTKKEKTYHFSMFSHYDIEKGVIFQLKNGSIHLMDNAKAVSLLVKQLEQFGVKRGTVNRHNRSYIKSR